MVSESTGRPPKALLHFMYILRVAHSSFLPEVQVFEPLLKWIDPSCEKPSGPGRQKISGFTLLEVILALVLAAVLTAIAGMGMVMGTRGYIFARENTGLGQKAELALARMGLEIMAMTGLVAASVGSGVEDPFLVYDNPRGRFAIAKIDDQILIYDLPATATGLTGTGDVLIDSVKDAAGAFTITLLQRGGGGWVLGTDAFADLDRVEIDLTLVRSSIGVDEVTLPTRTIYLRNR
jgi:prepilin-type N-terminal cleavage/methylation domain-containing protein